MIVYSKGFDLLIITDRIVALPFAAIIDDTSAHHNLLFFCILIFKYGSHKYRLSELHLAVLTI